MYCEPQLPWLADGTGWVRNRVHREGWDTGLPPEVRRKSPTAGVYKVELTYGCGKGAAHKCRFYLPYVRDPKVGAKLRRWFYAYLRRALNLSFAEAWEMTRERRAEIVAEFKARIRWDKNRRDVA